MLKSVTMFLAVLALGRALAAVDTLPQTPQPPVVQSALAGESGPTLARAHAGGADAVQPVTAIGAAADSAAAVNGPGVRASQVAGFSYREIPAAVRAHLPKLLTAGVRGTCVDRVTAPTPAASWGLCAHDLVLAADGEAIADGEDLARRLIGAKAPRELTVIRGGSLLSLVPDAAPQAAVAPFALPKHAAAISTSTPRLKLALSSADGQQFHIDVVYVDPQQGALRRVFKGPRAQVAVEMLQLPEAVREEIRRQLEFRPADGFGGLFQ